MEPLITFDNLPTTVNISGEIYHINYGYRTMMAIEMQMFGKNNDEQKVLNALNLFYGENIPVNRGKAIEYMLWFHFIMSFDLIWCTQTYTQTSRYKF